jgi:acid phosphatase
MYRMNKMAAAIAALASGLVSFQALAITGVVVGNGYYQNAKVCLDSNTNARCDAGEAYVMSDSNGGYNLNGSGNVVAEIQVGTATLASNPVNVALTLRNPAANLNGVISAVTTEVQALMDANGGDYATALAVLSARVGVSEAQLLEDFNTESNSAAAAALNNEAGLVDIRIAGALSDSGSAGNLVNALRNRVVLDNIKTIVVIYPENRSFDNLFGNYPGANGLKTAAAKAIKQLDRDGVTVLPYLPPSWGGLTLAGQTPVVTQAQTTNLWPNGPFQLDNSASPAYVAQSTITRDLYHRFFENQMQIDGGKNDMFVAWGDSGGTVMGYFNTSNTFMWSLAHQYTLADNFFQGAFGGSFLNHQYLICGCAPSVPSATVSANGMSLNTLTTPLNGVPQLLAGSSQTASALNGAAALQTGNIAPLDYFGSGDGYRAVNTMQPPYQPSSNAPAASDTTLLYANPASSTTLPPQTQTHIGDLLNAKNISWAWYTGSWDSVTAAATAAGHNIPAAPIFQFHHQPFNYFAEFDPVAHAADRATHLKDRTDLVAQANAGTLPSVVFYKPQGSVNQHPGYSTVTSFDNDLQSIITTLQASPQWSNMLIVVAYDEFGGQFDHVAPPKGDLVGPGTRIPALVVSPFAKKGFVDHNQYDTGSILRLITHRYSLTPLNGLNVRDNALTANGGKAMGYLGGTLNFLQ